MIRKMVFLQSAAARLPNLAHPSSWIALAVFAGAVLLGGCKTEQPQSYGHLNSESRHSDSFEQIPPKEDLYKKVFDSAGQQSQLHERLSLRFLTMAQYIERFVRDGEKNSVSSYNNGDWIGDDFIGHGVPWDALKPRFEDRSTNVSRWQASPDSPRFKGDNALERFVASVFQQWAMSKEFRIDIKPYSTRALPESDGGFIEAKMVVEIFGNTEAQKGLQATSLWTTRWVDDQQNNKLQISTADVKAVELVTLNAPKGQLFEDCTESILSRTTLIKDQLVYGLDQWARKIPGLDIVGHQGLSVGDVNQDGFDDLYICQPHGLPNLLLIQNPDGTAEDMGAQAGVDILDDSRASLMIDIDNDGDQDLVVTTEQSLVLMSNKGKGEFQLEHELAIGHSGHSVSAADYDQDGDLDLYICKYDSVKNFRDLIAIPDSFENANSGGRNILLRNDEGWNFVDVTSQVGFGIDENARYSRSAVWVDYDLDGDQDLYVANEWSSDQLFENDGGWFSDVAPSLDMLEPAQHRSVSTGEFNHDGKPDFFVATDAPLMAYQGLADNKPLKELSKQKQAILGEDQIWFSKQQTNGQASVEGFESFFLRAPIFAAETAYSSVAADINNDGLDDVIVTNGHLTRSSSEDVGGMLYAHMVDERASKANDNNAGFIAHCELENDVLALARSGYSLLGRQRNRCYLSIGKLGFANFSSASGVDFLEDARAVATTDWDDDGDVDVVMTSRNGPRMRILLNQNRSENNFLHFKLVGTSSNLDAIGARVEVFLEGKESPLVKFVSAGSGNLSQSSKRLFFGLGKQSQIQKAVVTWPSGQQQAFTDLVANTRYIATEGEQQMAERNNERFQLKTAGSDLAGTLVLPNRDVASFSPTAYLPNLEFENEKRKFQPIQPLNDSFTTVVFFGDDHHSRAIAKQIKANASEFQPEKRDCVGIFVDRIAEDQNQRFDAAARFFTEQDFPFRWGAATGATKEKLTQLNGHWFSQQQLPQLPFAVLMNKQGRVERIHWLTATKSPEKLVNYLNRDAAERSDRSNKAPDAKRGRWLARYREADLLRLVERFNQLGMTETADLMFKLNRPNAALKLSQFAADLRSENNFQRAKKFFDRAIDLYPYCVPALVGRGQMIRYQANRTGESDEQGKLLALQVAADNFQLASEIDPLCTAAIVGRANVLIDQNRVNDAIIELKKYLAIDPARAEVHAILGRLYFANRKFPDAAKHLLVAYELRPNLPYVAGDLGYLYLSSGEVALGRKFLRLANRLQPSEQNIVRHLAEAEFVNGNFARAAELLGMSIELNPNKRRPKELLAWLLATSPYEATRDGAQGKKMMEPLMLMVGDRSPSTLEIYAACFAESRDFDAAIEYQDRAIALVRSGKTSDTYSQQQKDGMIARLELYQRQRPYRMQDLRQIPIKTSLNRIAKK